MAPTADEEVPRGQLVHDAEPTPLSKKPAPHGAQVEAAAEDVDPAAQATQYKDEFAPRAGDAVPAAQGRHVKFELAPAVVEKLPATQRSQTAEPTAANAPPPQSWHTADEVALGTADAVPAGQLVQAPASAPEYEPAGHPVQTDAPAAAAVPAAHTTQSELDVPPVELSAVPEGQSWQDAASGLVL